MAVTNVENAFMDNVVGRSAFRLARQARAIANTDIQVVPAGAPPVQIVTTSGTGPAVLRLPLAELDATVYFIRNAGTQVLTVTDDAGSPATIMSLAAATGAMIIKNGATYLAVMESAAIA